MAPVLVAVNVGTTPETGTLFTSFKVIVTVEGVTPSAVMFVVPVMVEVTAETAVGANTTVPPVTLTGVRSERVFVSAVVEARVQVAVPVESDDEQTP